jgi:hypothetical protein
MKIYYDNQWLKWYQNSLEHPISLGANLHPVSFQEASSDHLSFNLRIKNNHAGPLIGIITGRKKNGTLAGNGLLFKELQQKLISLDGISFIFTLEDVHDDYINGFIYSPEKNRWLRVKVPYPDLVYNRIPFRRIEKSPPFQKLISALKEKNIPFFNPSFINKYELFRVLHDDSKLRSNLPETILVDQKDMLYSFMVKHKTIYFKPLQSSRGKGIAQVKLGEGNEVFITGLTFNDHFPSFEDFWEEWQKVFHEKAYLAQKEIKYSKYNGKRFDFRVLGHAHFDEYIVTGIGIRQSQGQEITTHIPAGGRLIPYDKIKSKKHDEFFHNAVNEVGKTLSHHFGYFGEFSIDAGIDESGQYFIYEVNAKPMKFDETEIEVRKIEQLCSLFLQLTNF